METAVLKVPHEPLGWRYFIPLSCAEGRLWDLEYCGAEGLDLAGAIDQAVDFMRQRKVEAGALLLEECRARMRMKAEAVSPSILKVFDRWYYGALAYYFYALGEHSRARESLDLATEAIGDAIAFCPFLRVLARACPELCLNRARTFRNQRLWREMRATIDLGWDMIEGRVPLCYLRDGSTVFVKDIDDFFRSITPGGSVEEKALDLLIDPQVRHRFFDGLVRKVEYFPNIVVPWT